MFPEFVSVVQRASLCLQISMKEHLEDSLLQCTMQDLLRYDDYNNDGHLSLHEFYTAFRELLIFRSISLYLKMNKNTTQAEP